MLPGPWLQLGIDGPIVLHWSCTPGGDTALRFLCCCEAAASVVVLTTKRGCPHNVNSSATVDSQSKRDEDFSGLRTGGTDRSSSQIRPTAPSCCQQLGLVRFPAAPCNSPRFVKWRLTPGDRFGCRPANPSTPELILSCAHALCSLSFDRYETLLPFSNQRPSAPQYLDFITMQGSLIDSGHGVYASAQSSCLSVTPTLGIWCTRAHSHV